MINYIIKSNDKKVLESKSYIEDKGYIQFTDINLNYKNEIIDSIRSNTSDFNGIFIVYSDHYRYSRVYVFQDSKVIKQYRTNYLNYDKFNLEEVIDNEEIFNYSTKGKH